jgi:nucleolar protein 9
MPPSPRSCPYSLLALGVEQLLVLCHDATASRVIDALFTCTSVPKAARRKFALALQGHYERLVCDRIGSRVGERVWAGAEPYLREKLARALLPHEAALAGDAFGKFFARRLKLHVLRRRPDEWREIQAAPPATEPTSVPAPAAAPAPPTREGGSERKPKRKVDAIDALFDGAGLGGGGKKKRGVLKADVGALTTQDEVGADLGSVLGAIKSAPKWDKPAKKKKRKE